MAIPSVYISAVETTMPTKTKDPKKGETITFRPLKKDESRIEAAEHLTGMPRSELAMKCMQKSLDDIVSEVLAEQDRLREEYGSKFARQRKRNGLRGWY